MLITIKERVSGISSKAIQGVKKVEYKTHDLIRKTPVYVRFGHVSWLNRFTKAVIKAIMLMALVVMMLELMIGATGFMLIYWVLSTLLS